MQKHILIVGGGVIGLSIAHYCLQRGHRVTVLERGAPDHDMASLGNAGMIVPSHFVPLATPGAVKLGIRMMLNPESPFYIRPRLDANLFSWLLKFMRSANAKQIAAGSRTLRDLNLHSRTCYEELANERDNDFGLQKRGLLMLCNTEHGLHEETDMARTANGLGIPAEVVSVDELRKLEPNIRMNVVGAVYFPMDCHLNPRLFVAGLVKAIQQRGGNILWNTSVSGWNASNGRIQHAQSNAGTHEADEYVIAGGAWSQAISRSLNVSLPMQAGKGYSLTMTNPKQQPSICAIGVEGRIAITPMGNTLRFGGTMEIAGLDESVNMRRVNGIINSAVNYFPGYTAQDFASIPVWRGLRPCSPDGLPYVGRFGHYQNLSVAAGHAMLGLSMAPVTGKLMSEILSDDAPALDITTLCPDRFA